jgi:hypothetical protein
MGLDMYLTAVRFLHQSPEIARTIGEIFNGAPTIVSVRASVGTWRKANAIHKCFVTHVQGGDDDCDKYEVEQEDLETLLESVKAVLNDTSKAQDLLPTTQGFFFGSVEYDEDYLQELRDTQTIVEKALQMSADGWSIEYQSSW